MKLERIIISFEGGQARAEAVFSGTRATGCVEDFFGSLTVAIGDVGGGGSVIGLVESAQSALARDGQEAIVFALAALVAR